jgi:hypothetical protein
MFGVFEQSLHLHTSATHRILSPIPGAVIKIALQFAAGIFPMVNEQKRDKLLAAVAI